MSIDVCCVDCGKSLTDKVSRRLRRGRVCRKRAGIVVVTVRASAARQGPAPARAARRRPDVAPDQMELDLGEAS